MGGKMSKHNYGWGMSEQKMCIDIKDGDKILFSIFIGEAMENAGRNNVMKHVRECDNSPWLKDWQDEKATEVIRVLTDK
jgi:hypothetical protein